MKKLILKNSEWLRGRGLGTLIVTEDSADNSEREDGALGFQKCHIGKRCCLGIAARLFGVPDEALSFTDVHGKRRGFGFPDTLLAEHGWPVKDYSLEQYGTLKSQGAIGTINDDTLMSDEERVARLRPLFLDNGIEIEYRADE
jgi:hypothetical protein